MPCVVELLDDLEDRLDDDRRKTHRRLVEHQQRRLAHQRAAHREHLLLAAGERAALLGDALLEAREELEDVVEVGLDLVLVLAQERAHLEVLHDGHAREDATTLGNLDDALAGDDVRLRAADRLALILDGAALRERADPRSS